LAFGAYHALPEVVTHDLGGTALTFEESELEGNHPLPKGAKRLDAESFANFIERTVQKRHTPQQLAELRPVSSVDIRRPVLVLTSKPELPPVAAAATPGRDNGEPNPAEEELLRHHDGDPLFKGADHSRVR
jgi:hypothetical protein